MSKKPEWRNRKVRCRDEFGVRQYFVEGVTYNEEVESAEI